MRCSPRVVGAAAGLALAGIGARGDDAAPAAWIERRIAASAPVRSLRCEARRETEVNGERAVLLSRVWFQRPDRLHVESAAPVPRRIVVDGVAIHKWVEGHPDGLRLPLAEAPEAELIQVRRVPGTAEEQLLRLRGLPDIELPPTADFPARRGFRPPAPHPYTVVSLDTEGRVARVEYFENERAERPTLATEYSGWQRTPEGVWLAAVQRTTARGRDGEAIVETLRLSGLAVNVEIEPERFDPARWARGVRFQGLQELTEKLTGEKK